MGVEGQGNPSHYLTINYLNYDTMHRASYQTAARMLLAIASTVAAGCVSAAASTTNVSVVNFAFNPPAVAINLNDQVKWNWASGLTFHSTTSSSGLWDSGLHTNGFTFTHTFTNSGSFPYICTLHPFMTASVTVRAANVPPSVTLSAPTNGTAFVAPWTGTITSTNFDSDGTVTKLEFFAGATLLGAVTNPAANVSVSVTNLAAGNYTLTGVATDNSGATTTSAGVSIQVLSPAPIILSGSRLASGAFQFTYSTTPGLTYVIRRAGQLPGFTPVATNIASQNTSLFQDPAPPGQLNFYSVSLMSNP